MAVQIASNAMPTAMADRGILYDWQRPKIVGRNGRGRVVTAGYHALHWGWAYLTDAEWDWWVTTILAGNRDALITTGTTQLYNDNKTLTTITSCIVHRPVHETIRNGVHFNVRLLIDQIVPA